MTEYAPAAITALFNTVKAAIPQAVMGGIIGDSAHTYGYHRGRNYVGGNDYSVQTPPDKQGNGEAASALDISWSSAQAHYDASQRLLNARNDSRMAACREFYGSTDGQTVCGWDYYDGYAVTSDDSHLWHVHLSILRQYADDHAACQAIASVITGGAADAPPTEEDELSDADVQKINAHTDESAGMVLYGDGRDVPASQNTHPDNIKRTRADIAAVKADTAMMIYGDSREATEEGTNTHPFNLYQMWLDLQEVNQKLDRLLSEPGR